MEHKGIEHYDLQGSAKRQSTGLVKFVTALAYHFCPALPAAFWQPGDHLLTEPYISYSPFSFEVDGQMICIQSCSTTGNELSIAAKTMNVTTPVFAKSKFEKMKISNRAFGVRPY